MPDDDLEYLDGHAPTEPLGPCWSCQIPVNTSNCIRIAQRHIPVCESCWKEVPAGQRILIAQKLASAPQFENLADGFAKLIGQALADGGGWPWDKRMTGDN